MRLIHGGAGAKVRGRNSSESIAVTVTPVSLPVSQTGIARITTNDVVNDHISSVTQDQVFKYVVSQSTGAVVISSDDLGVATVDGDTSNVVDDGVSIIRVSDDKDDLVIKRPIYTDVIAASYDQFVSYAAGSLCEHVFNQVSNRINGLAASNDTFDIFTAASQEQTVNDLIRNPNLWCADLDISGIGMELGKAATAISPRHVFSATHYKPTGAIYFVLNDNSVITRNVGSWQSVDGTDLSIGYLDADLPAGVKQYKVLPENYLSYMPGMFVHMPTINTSHSGSGWGINRFMKLQEPASISGGGTLVTKSDSFMLAKHIPWHIPVALSGEPNFIIINNELIAIAENWVRYGYVANGGKFLSDYITEVNTIMTNQHGSAEHQLQEVDLTDFSTFL